MKLSWQTGSASTEENDSNNTSIAKERSAMVLQAIGLMAMVGTVLALVGSPSDSSSTTVTASNANPNMMRGLSSSSTLESNIKRSLTAHEIAERIRILDDDMDYLKSMLPNYTLEAMEDDPESPQSMAFDFILNDPNMGDYSDARVQQRFALATLFYSAGGANLTNYEDWIQTDVHECDWGLLANLTAREVLTRDELYFAFADPDTLNPCNDKGMYQVLIMEDIEGPDNGTLPEEVFDLLPSLLGVSIRNTNLTGAIPSTIGTLSNLTSLQLMESQFTGMIPIEIGNMTKLKTLDLQRNMISGEIPVELGQIRLRNLDLSFNDLSGIIPEEILRPSVWFFYVNDNPNLEGSFPDLQTRANINIENTGISGEIPARICNGALRLSFDCSDSLCGCGKKVCPCGAANNPAEVSKQLVDDFGWRN